MINTELLNAIREQQVKNIVINTDIINTRSRQGMLKERLKSAAWIALTLFFVALLVMILLKLYGIGLGGSRVQNSSDFIPSKQTDIPSVITPFAPFKNIDKNDSAPLANGIDYIKFNNYIYKRVWKNGLLVKSEMLERSIEESRSKRDEKIPQFSVPK